MVVRICSMSTGLDASTVTPGRIAPLESCTTPTMLPRSCADTSVGIRSAAAVMHAAANVIETRRMKSSLCRIVRGRNWTLILRGDLHHVNSFSLCA